MESIKSISYIGSNVRKITNHEDKILVLRRITEELSSLVVDGNPSSVLETLIDQAILILKYEDQILELKERLVANGLPIITEPLTFEKPEIQVLIKATERTIQNLNDRDSINDQFNLH